MFWPLRLSVTSILENYKLSHTLALTHILLHYKTLSHTLTLILTQSHILTHTHTLTLSHSHTHTLHSFTLPPYISISRFASICWCNLKFSEATHLPIDENHLSVDEKSIGRWFKIPANTRSHIIFFWVDSLFGSHSTKTLQLLQSYSEQVGTYRNIVSNSTCKTVQVMCKVSYF